MVCFEFRLVLQGLEVWRGWMETLGISWQSDVVVSKRLHEVHRIVVGKL